MRMQTQKRLIAAVFLATIATLGATLLVAEGDSVEPRDNPVQFAAVPLGLAPLLIPASNPQTAAKIELGRRLYFDPRLSVDGTVSCASCHSPRTGWADGRPTSKGIDGQIGGRNAPTIINAAYQRTQFWDGRAASLEEQALGPIENPIEMGHTLNVLVSELAQIPDYRTRFRTVFETEVTKEGIGQAIAAFERTILSGNSPYDQFVAGNDDALTAAQERGMEVFMDKADCATCHTPPLFTNGRFYNTGVGMSATEPDIGRMAVTERPRDKGKFRVPTLRDVADTAPYFHDGSAATLAEAVDLMAGGGLDNGHLSSMLRSLREIEITEQDRSDLVEFLKALSGEFPVIEPPTPPGPG